MDVRYHFCREKVESGDIEVQYCAMDILADVLTKPLASVRQNKLCTAIMAVLELQGGVLRNIVLYRNQVATPQMLLY
jgi:hypothetical protein